MDVFVILQFIFSQVVPPKPPRPPHRLVPATMPGSSPNISHMLNSVAPPPTHSSWGSIDVLGDGQGAQSGVCLALKTVTLDRHT